MTTRASLSSITDKSFGAAEAIRAAAGAPPLPKDIWESVTDGRLGMITRYHPVYCFSRLAYVNEVPVGALIASLEKTTASSRRAAKAQAKAGQYYVKVHCVAVLPCFQRRGIGRQLVENLVKEVGSLNQTTLPPEAVDLPEALTATRVQSLSSTLDVVWYELKNTLKATRRLPLTRVEISPVGQGEQWLSKAQQWEVPKEMKVHDKLPELIEWRFEP